VCRNIKHSRPFTTLDSQPDDCVVSLTPGHYLHQCASTVLPSDNAPPGTCTYSKIASDPAPDPVPVEKMTKRISPTAAEKKQMENSHQNLQPGDVVLVKKDTPFQKEWPMGRVTDVHPGADGLVQTVDVTYKGRSFRRPIHKLVKLLVEGVVISPRGEDGQA